MSEYKILFCGPSGAGKTTAIHAVSEVVPVSSEVRNTTANPNPATAWTTAGMDYGRLMLEDGDWLTLYGSPGQERFNFMWPILARGALGVIILLDNHRPDPVADLAFYLEALADVIGQGSQAACVVAVGRMEATPQPDLAPFARCLEAHDVLCPLLCADVRQRQQVVQLIDLLLLQAQALQPA